MYMNDNSNKQFFTTHILYLWLPYYIDLMVPVPKSFDN